MLHPCNNIREMSNRNHNGRKRKEVAYEGDHNDILDDAIAKYNLKKKRVGQGYVTSGERIPSGVVPQSLRDWSPRCVVHT